MFFWSKMQVSKKGERKVIHSPEIQRFSLFTILYMLSQAIYVYVSLCDGFLMLFSVLYIYISKQNEDQMIC